MLRSCGDAASRHASRSASGIPVSTSSSPSVVPAPIVDPLTPRGTTPRTSTRVVALSSPSCMSGTTSVPPWIKTPPSSSSTLDGRRSSTASLLLRGPERAQHLLARDRQLTDLGARRVADRVRDRGGDRDDRRLAEPLRSEVREMRVGLVDELADDLGHVGDRRHPIALERRCQHPPGLRIEEPVLRERVPDPLDDAALDLARGTERIDDPTDVMNRRDALDDDLARLDIDRDLDDVDAEGEDAHAGRVRPA